MSDMPKTVEIHEEVLPSVDFASGHAIDPSADVLVVSAGV